MISSTSSAKFACLLNFSYRHTCKYAVLNYRFHEHRGMQLRLEYLSTNVHARENLFCFRQELSDRFTSACMHAREQTYGKSTSTLVALGAVPCSALSGSRLLLTGGVPGKYRKQRLQNTWFHRRNITFCFHSITACTLHRANSRSGVANFKRFCSLACAFFKACCAQSVYYSIYCQ